jgi:hypothetical protein
MIAEKMSRNSLIYHLGMEGLGGFDLVEDPDSAVSLIALRKATHLL